MPIKGGDTQSFKFGVFPVNEDGRIHLNEDLLLEHTFRPYALANVNHSYTPWALPIHK